MDHSAHAAAIFNKLANVYQAKFMDVSLYGNTLDFFCTALKPKAEVLEVACGPGNITHYLLQKRPDLHILGTDLAPNMLELAKINNPQATFALLDCRDICSLDKKFDAIMCGFCLPYLSRTEALQFIHNASGIINSGGVIYISTMEDDYANSAFKKGSGGDEIFMHYHEATYLMQALTENKFGMLSMERITYPAPDGTTVTDLVIIAKKVNELE